MNNQTATIDFNEEIHLEWIIQLEGYRFVIGNLPMPLLVQEEDFSIHGFGVGILSANEFAERREFLLHSGHHPVYAYLVNDTGDQQMALNSHEYGMEQIFIRAFPYEKEPYWEVTITSYERIVDLVKYKITMPESLVDLSKSYNDNYITPIYFTEMTTQNNFQ